MDTVVPNKEMHVTSGRGPERRPLAGNPSVRRQERRESDADEFAL